MVDKSISKKLAVATQHKLADAIRHKLACMEATKDPLYRSSYASDAAQLAVDLAVLVSFEHGIAAGSGKRSRKKVTR